MPVEQIEEVTYPRSFPGFELANERRDGLGDVALARLGRRLIRRAAGAARVPMRNAPPRHPGAPGTAAQTSAPFVKRPGASAPSRCSTSAEFRQAAQLVGAARTFEARHRGYDFLARALRADRERIEHLRSAGQGRRTLRGTWRRDRDRRLWRTRGVSPPARP